MHVRLKAVAPDHPLRPVFQWLVCVWWTSAAPTNRRQTNGSVLQNRKIYKARLFQFPTSRNLWMNLSPALLTNESKNTLKTGGRQCYLFSNLKDCLVGKKTNETHPLTTEMPQTGSQLMLRLTVFFGIILLIMTQLSDINIVAVCHQIPSPVFSCDIFYGGWGGYC